MNVPICKFPVPVALVNVRPVSAETPEMFKDAPVISPEAVMFVEETEARDDWPEMERDPPCKNPDAVRFVPDAFVKVTL